MPSSSFPSLTSARPRRPRAITWTGVRSRRRARSAASASSARPRSTSLWNRIAWCAFQSSSQACSAQRLDVLEQARCSLLPAIGDRGLSEMVLVVEGEPGRDARRAAAIAAIEVEAVGALAQVHRAADLAAPEGRHREMLEGLGALFGVERGGEQVAALAPVEARHRAARPLRGGRGGLPVGRSRRWWRETSSSRRAAEAGVVGPRS